jgi:hypothetical protein
MNAQHCSREIRTPSILQGDLGGNQVGHGLPPYGLGDTRRDFIRPHVLNSDVSHTIVLIIMIWWNRYEERCYFVLDSGNTYRILVCTLYGLRVSIYRKTMQLEWWSTIVSEHEKRTWTCWVIMAKSQLLGCQEQCISIESETFRQSQIALK